MNNFFYLLILLSISINGQTKIDKFVSIEFPGEVEKFDTAYKGRKIENFMFQRGSETFMVEKTIFDSTSNDLNSLPSDKESLRKFYRGSIKGMFIAMKTENIYFADLSQIMIDEYLCYKANGKSKNKKVVESIFLFLNEDLYVISYLNLVDFDEKDKEGFLKSLKIDSSLSPSQTLGNSFGNIKGYIDGKKISFILIGGLMLFLIRKFKK